MLKRTTRRSGSELQSTVYRSFHSLLPCKWCPTFLSAVWGWWKDNGRIQQWWLSLWIQALRHYCIHPDAGFHHVSTDTGSQIWDLDLVLSLPKRAFLPMMLSLGTLKLDIASLLCDSFNASYCCCKSRHLFSMWLPYLFWCMLDVWLSVQIGVPVGRQSWSILLTLVIYVFIYFGFQALIAVIKKLVYKDGPFGRKTCLLICSL